MNKTEEPKQAKTRNSRSVCAMLMRGWKFEEKWKGNILYFCLSSGWENKERGRDKMTHIYFWTKWKEIFLITLDIPAYVTSSYVLWECVHTLALLFTTLLRHVSTWARLLHDVMGMLHWCILYFLNVVRWHGTCIHIISFTKKIWAIPKPLFTKRKNVQQYDVQIS